jgi:hypothetical protein
MAAKTVVIDANPGTSTPGLIAPDVNPGNNTATYNYTIFDGQSVVDTIPVQICMVAPLDPGWTSDDITFGSPTPGLPGVTVPLDTTFLSSAALPDCRSLSIQISTGTLTLANPNVAQNFVTNFHLSDTNGTPGTGANQPHASFADTFKFQIKVEVLPANNLTNVSCFLTDSNGSFLNDCAGLPVTESGSDDGRFAIVANKKNIEVATNPGQFYFNFVWLNTTGADKTVTVDFQRLGVNPNGAQAIHSAVFNGYLSSVTQSDFDEANLNGIPDGTDDQASGILVPAGSSLLVTYHLTWAGLSAPVPANCATNCGTANQLIQVTGTVSGEGVTEESCTSQAYGYKK